MDEGCNCRSRTEAEDDSQEDGQRVGEPRASEGSWELKLRRLGGTAAPLAGVARPPFPFSLIPSLSFSPFPPSHSLFIPDGDPPCNRLVVGTAIPVRLIEWHRRQPFPRRQENRRRLLRRRLRRYLSSSAFVVGTVTHIMYTRRYKPAFEPTGRHQIRTCAIIRSRHRR